MVSKQKDFTHVILLAILVGVFIVGGGWYVLSKKSLTADTPPIKNIQVQSQKSISTSNTTTLPTATSQKQDIDTSNWKVYRNEKYGFEVRFPQGWMVESENEPMCEHGKYGDGQPECIEMAVELSTSFLKDGQENPAWFSVDKTTCGQIKQNEWQLSPDRPDGVRFLSKYVCNNDLFITLELFNDNPKKELYKTTLDKILSTFKFSTSNARQKIEYTKGQYIDIVSKIAERVQDCGGGGYCLNYTIIQLPEEVSADYIHAIRMYVDGCVDKTLQRGDAVRVQGIIEKVEPDIGLILSCDSRGTSVTRQ